MKTREWEVTWREQELRRKNEQAFVQWQKRVGGIFWRDDRDGHWRVRESNSLSPVHESEQGLMSYELSQEPPFSQIP